MALKSTKPSQQQLEVYFLLIQHVSQHGYQPSQRELATAFGITQASIKDRLKGLEEHSLIEFPAGKKRDRAIKINRVRFRPEFDKTMAETGRWMEGLLD